MLVLIENSTIEKFEDRRLGEITIIHKMNNNILIYCMSYLGGNQDKSENWELYQDINNPWVETKAKKFLTWGAHYSWNN